MIVCLCILDQGVFGQMSRHHTHTNALNPLASSASVGEGLRSHGGASLLPGGLVGRSGSVMLKKNTSDTEIA